MLFVIIPMLSALNQITAALYLPSFTTMTDELHTNMEALQWTLALYLTGCTFAQLIYGPISDGVGRLRPLLCGLLLGVLGGVLCLCAHSVEMLLLGRLIEGLGIGAGSALMWTMLRDLYHGDDLVRYGSYAALIINAFLMLGPIMGAYLQIMYGWRANFVFLLIATVALSALILCFIGETARHQNKENLVWRVVYRNTRHLLTSSEFIAYSTCSAMAYGAITAWLTAGAVILQDVLLLDPLTLGWYYTITGVGFMVGALLNSYLAPRYGITHMLLVGLAFIGLGGALSMLCVHFNYVDTWGILPAMTLVLFGSAMTLPNAFAGSLSHYPHIAGLAGSVFGFIRVLGGALTSGILAFAHDKDQGPMGCVILTCALIAILSLCWVKRRPSTKL